VRNVIAERVLGLPRDEEGDLMPGDLDPGGRDPGDARAGTAPAATPSGAGAARGH
jgi:hypothetical protein